MSNDFDPFQNRQGIRLMEQPADEDESEVIEQPVPVLFYIVVFCVVFSGTLGLLLMFKDVFNPF